MPVRRRLPGIVLLVCLGVSFIAFGQSSDSPEPLSENISPASIGEASPVAVEEPASSGSSANNIVVSGNPAVSNLFLGSGWLANALGLNQNGFRFSGINITDGNGILSGGEAPGSWTCDSLTIAELTIDAEKFVGWDGALFGAEFLYYSGGNVNGDAGSVMGYNSLSGPPPHNRAEFYELWYRQELFDEKLIVRIGKSVPTYDFNNVTRPVATSDQTQPNPTISSAILTPLYVSPTVLGVWPGYYNSACGITTMFVPTKRIAFQYACYDGNLANGRQTGLEGPRFNGHYLHLAEVNSNWTIGAQNKPGAAGIGGWHQTGWIRSFSGFEQGASGFYCFGSQRLYYERPGESNNGLSAYLQFAATDSDRVFAHRYFGVGVSYVGPIPRRDHDALGFSLAHGKMSNDPNAGAIFNLPPPGIRNTRPLGSDETILTWYYQAKVYKNTLLQPNLSYILNPARIPGTPDAMAVTIRVIVLF